MTGTRVSRGIGRALLSDVHRAVRSFTCPRGVVVPLPAGAALLSLVGACGLAVSFDYGVSGENARDSGLYAVQGTLSGLGHSKVTLALNHLRLTVGDGPFVFSAAVPEGAPFRVDVPEQPFGHLCSLDNAAGTIAGKNAGGIVVWCPSTNAEIASLTLDSCNNYVSSCNDASPVVPFEFVPTNSLIRSA